MNYKMHLTPEEEEILNGGKGETMAKVMKTLVMYGDAFGATKMVPVTSKMGHLVTSFGLGVMQPVYDLMDHGLPEGQARGLRDAAPLPQGERACGRGKEGPVDTAQGATSGCGARRTSSRISEGTPRRRGKPPHRPLPGPTYSRALSRAYQPRTKPPLNRATP